MTRWKVHKVANLLSPNWVVHEPDGSWSGSFDTWGEAFTWATSFSHRVEQWLRRVAQ